jgi:hypothetical protein
VLKSEGNQIFTFVRRFLNQEKLFRYNWFLAPLEILFFYFLSLGAKSRFKKAYSKFQTSCEVPDNIASIIILANFRTKGAIRKISQQNVSNKPINQGSELFLKNEIELALSNLKQYGFSNVGILRDRDLLTTLDSLSNSKVYSSLDFKSSGRSNINLVSSPDPNYDHIWYVEPETALENIALQKIILDPFWKIIADTYLGASSKISALRCWHSYEHRNGERLTPENWHLDAADGLNFIKFFVLLTDVDENSGPTSVVPIPSTDLPRRFYTGRRYTDKEVENLLNSKKLKVLNATGQKGLIYVADTRLLHRGTPVLKGHRFLLNWTCSLDSFGTVKNEKYNLKHDNLLKIKKIL